VQRQVAAGIFARRTRDSENLGFAPRTQFSGKIGLRLNQDAGPSGLLQRPSLRAFAWIIGADFDKIPFDVAEESGNEPYLMI
jgi:hypothetical protein